MDEEQSVEYHKFLMGHRERPEWEWFSKLRYMIRDIEDANKESLTAFRLLLSYDINSDDHWYKDKRVWEALIELTKDREKALDTENENG